MKRTHKTVFLGLAFLAVVAWTTPTVLIPGHGPVDRSASAYRHTLDLLARRASQVEDP